MIYFVQILNNRLIQEKSIFSRCPCLLKWTIFISTGFLLFLFITDAIFPFRPAIAYSQIVLADDGSILHASISPDQKWRFKTELNDISPVLRKIIIYKEDKYFFYHFGFNPIAIARAAFRNTLRGQRTSGASTITMQVVRLLHPRGRNYTNKLFEMFQAMQLELHFSKNEILQMYLSLAPYGGNIEGVKAAALLYFGQTPQALSLAQVVTLSVIPNNPRVLRPGDNNRTVLERRNHWLHYLSEHKLFSDAVINSALSEPIVMTRQEAPAKAPHFSRQIASRFAGSATVETYISRHIQEIVENIVFAEVRRTSNMNITNAAVIVVDNKRGAIVAYAGSSDFNDFLNQGQVDGITALRSPGSTLKPYLYALAVDNGIVTPKMKLNDIPSNFNGYRPENYDQTFRGSVTMEQALEQSLNIPAVKLADRIGINFFNESLAKAGFSWIGRHRQKLGLSVVLGGCGVQLMELTALYATFANGGIYRPLRWAKEQNKSKQDTLFSPAAAFMISEILTQLKRPDVPTQFDNTVHLPHIAWKTGTSYGRHDAWSIGYNPDYTIGVWMGNFNGEGVAELNGSDYAAPLLFKIFNALPNSQNWFTQPDGMDFRLVCAESGLPPDTFCKDHIMDYYIPGISGNQKCHHLKEVFVNEDATLSYCTSCIPANGYIRKMYPDLAPDVLAYYEEQQIPYSKIPAHNQLCSRIYATNAPTITSLTEGMEYVLMKSAKQELMLGCAAENGVKKVYWYINNRFYKAAGPSEKVFFVPGSGHVKVSCSDDKGRNSDIRILVSFI